MWRPPCGQRGHATLVPPVEGDPREVPSPCACCISVCWSATRGAACASTGPTSGSTQASARRYPDGTIIVRNQQGFDLALHPGDPTDRLPAFLHFGFRLPNAEAVRHLLARMDADGVHLVERWDQAGYVAFKCLDPDGWRVEVYWEPVGKEDG